MSLNWKEINLVLSELTLEGAQIQKVTQTSWDVLTLGVYKEGRARSILIALTPGSCRLHETFRSVPRSDKPLRFAEFLKSRIRDGHIDEAVQLGTDRIIRIALHHGEDRYLVYVRLWSNAANVIVTDPDGRVLDAMRRSPKRGEISGGTFIPPEAASGEGPKKEFEVRDFGGEGNFNEKVDRYYAEHGGELSLAAIRERIKKLYAARLSRKDSAIRELEKKTAEGGEAEKWKQYGDLIMSGMGSIAAGTELFETENYYTGESVSIRLEKRKSPAANAELYYEKYRKAKNGAGAVLEELEAEKSARIRLETDLEKLLSMENPLALLKAERELRTPTQAVTKKRPGLSFRSNGWLLLVGRSGAENDELLRRHVKGSDLWLHARDYHGAYVFIKARSGKSFPLELLLDAGNLALFYSKARSSGVADLYYTPVKYLRRAKNGPKGLVLPTQEKNLRVKLDAQRLKRLEAGRE